MADVKLTTAIEQHIINPAKRAFTQIENQWCSLGRRISIWSENNLPEGWGKVASKIFYSSPIACAMLFFPLSLKLVLGAAFYIGHLAYGPFSQETIDTTVQGVFIGTSLLALANIVRVVRTPTAGLALSAIVYSVVSAVLLPHTKMTE